VIPPFRRPLKEVLRRFLGIASGRHTAHGRYPAATAVCSSAKNTRFLTYPPRAMARSAAGQSSLPYTRPGRWPPSAPGVALW